MRNIKGFANHNMADFSYLKLEMPNFKAYFET